jgi:hypothetical protein
VRNHGAKLHLMAMKPGERVLYYHSNADKAVVGIAEVVTTAYPGPDSGKRAVGVAGHPRGRAAEDARGAGRRQALIPR